MSPPLPHLARIAAATLVAAGLAAVPALADRPDPGDDSGKRISICHATGSQAHPYAYLMVAADAILDPRRDAVEGHGTDSGTHGRDIIPAFSFTWGGREYEYEGKNLDGDGPSLLANRCVAVADDAPTPPGGGSTPAGDADDMAPQNAAVMKDLDEVAPEGLGETGRPRTPAEAAPDEAVLRVAIRPSSRRPRVGQRVVFRVTGQALGPAAADDDTLCAAVPAGFSLVDAGSGMALGRVVCWLEGVAPRGTTTRAFVAVPLRSSAGRPAVAPATNSASNAYRVMSAATVRPQLNRRAIAVTG